MLTKRYKNTFVLLLSSILFSFLLAEVFCRITFDKINLLELTGQKPTPNPMSYWANNDPFSAYNVKAGIYKNGKTVNSHGFISTPEIDFVKKENTIRIVFLGESSTAGTGVNLKDEDTWPYKTIEILRSKGYQVDYINGALGGYTTFESYGRLWSNIRNFQPDIVIVNHGWNDSYYFSSDREKINNWRRDKDGSYSIKFKWLHETFAPLQIDNIIHSSQFLSKIRLFVFHQKGNGEIYNGREKNDPKIETATTFALATFESNLQLIKNFCEHDSIQLFICKQPTLFNNTYLPDSSELHYTGHDFELNDMNKVFRGIYSIIDKNFSPINIIELQQLSGIDSLFYDQIHPTVVGTTEISKIVSNQLIKHILSRNNFSDK